MKAKHKKRVNGAERLLTAKRLLVKRLRSDIRAIKARAAEDVEKVSSRIRIAQALVSALEKGTLRP